MISNADLIKKVEERYAAFSKTHPDISDVQGFLCNAIRLRVKSGKPITDVKLEKMMDDERRRIVKQEIFDEAQEPRKLHPSLQGMAIGMLIASCPPEYRGLVHGLSGLPLDLPEESKPDEQEIEKK